MRRIPRFKKRTRVLTAIVATVAAMASIGAYAYFTSTGSGYWLGDGRIGLGVDRRPDRHDGRARSIRIRPSVPGTSRRSRTASPTRAPGTST